MPKNLLTSHDMGQKCELLRRSLSVTTIFGRPTELAYNKYGLPKRDQEGKKRRPEKIRPFKKKTEMVRPMGLAP